MSVRISEMVERESAPKNESLMEISQPGDISGIDTRSVKVSTLTKRFNFSGEFDPTTQADMLFLTIPFEQLLQMTGYPSYGELELSLLGIGSGTIDVSIAVSETVPTAYTHIRTGAGRFNLVYNDGVASMKYFIAEDMNSDVDTQFGPPFSISFPGTYISNNSIVAAVPPVLTDISVNPFSGLSMRFEIRSGTYTPITVPFLYHGYVDLNINLKYGTPIDPEW